MRFALGYSRFVILTNRYAIKIARFYPIKPFIRIIKHLFGKKIKTELLTYDARMAKGCMKYVFRGIFANRAEFIFSRKYAEQGEIVPTLFSFCWLVNIQPVGKAATVEEMKKNGLYQRFGHDPSMDIEDPCQYCIIGTKVLLADYGQIELNSIFSA